MLRRLIVAGVGGLLFLVVVAAGFHWWVQDSLRQPLSFEGEIHTLMVERGGSLLSLSRRLHEQGLTNSPLPLQVHARMADTATIHAGEYLIKAGDSLLDLVDKMVRGEVVLHRVTFPEGRTLSQWLEIVAAHPILSAHPLPDLADLESLVAEQVELPPEGWFFPDTYTFPRDRPALDIFRQAHRRMTAILDEEWRQRQPDLPIDTPYEALILASIIEKETGVPHERGEIAGVFVRRLNLGMRLQTDPTVIYGLGDRFEGNLTRQHLREDTEFNTYRIDGLPPTPIANPGRDAIRAALNPEPGSTLFFVARGDGSHQFSDTLDQHNRAVRKYQLNRRPDYRSSPPPPPAALDTPEEPEQGAAE